MRYQGTDIDGPSLDPERLEVRGRDLNDLVGNMSYVAAQLFFVNGRELDGGGIATLDTLLTRSLFCLDPDGAPLTAVKQVAATGVDPSRATVAGLMADATDPVAAVVRAVDIDEAGLDELEAEGLVYLALLPALVAYAVETAAGRDTGRLDAALAEGPTEGPYLEHVFRLCRGRDPSEAERAVFEAIMVIGIGGFGFLTPTVMLARMAAGTRAPLPVTLAAGFTGAGPAHTGACEQAIAYQNEVAERIVAAADEPLEVARALVRDSLEAGERVPGFGHPLFQADPRIGRLRRVIGDNDFACVETETFELVARAMEQETGLHPNLDSIFAALFRAMRFDPAYGTGLFMCSRAGGMLAHVLEKLRRPPFGLSSSDARKYLESVPTGWI